MLGHDVYLIGMGSTVDGGSGDYLFARKNLSSALSEAELGQTLRCLARPVMAPCSGNGRRVGSTIRRDSLVTAVVHSGWPLRTHCFPICRTGRFAGYRSVGCLTPAAAVPVAENLIIEIRHGLPSLRPQIVIESRLVSRCLNLRVEMERSGSFLKFLKLNVLELAGGGENTVIARNGQNR